MRSPFNLVQEFAAEGPDPVWRVLIVCALLNRTHGRQVRPIIDEFFERFPSPADLCAAGDERVLELIRPLGLYDRRLRALRGISEGCARGTPPCQLPWVGDYALASVDIFCGGRTDVTTGDVWLNKYLGWRAQSATDKDK